MSALGCLMSRNPIKLYLFHYLTNELSCVHFKHRRFLAGGVVLFCGLVIVATVSQVFFLNGDGLILTTNLAEWN